MKTALIHITDAPGGGYEARLDPDWDERGHPEANMPRVSFTAGPEPPPGFDDWMSFLLETEGASDVFLEFGNALHDLVIAGDIRRELDRIAPPLRLLLKVEAETLDVLPWEFMRERGMPRLTDPSRPVARITADYDADLDLPRMCWPLKVLLVVGSKATDIQVEQEIGYVSDGFRKVCGLVDLKVLRLPDRRRVQNVCLDMQPHVFHFVGHGDFDDGFGGYLRLEQEDGPDVEWTRGGIRDDLTDGGIRLAVLNACQLGNPSAHRGTRSAAEGLAALRVPAVIAMQGPIRGDAAAAFARGLYGALSTGAPLDRAVAEARREITRVVAENQRDYALPALTLRAPPERILDLAHGDPGTRLSSEPLAEVLAFVDRVSKRRLLWERLQADQPPGPRIFTVTGPPKTGKGSLVRWCLGVALVRDHPVMLVDLPEGHYMDSTGFLTTLVNAPTAGDDGRIRTALQNFGADLEAGQQGRTIGQQPFQLYEKLGRALSEAAAGQTLIIGIDGLAGLELGHWATQAVPGFVKSVANGQLANIRLIVALHENERAARFPPQHFGESQVEDIPLQFFPQRRFVELATQRLRAQNYKYESFKPLVNGYLADFVKEQGYWDTQPFELLKLHAKVEKWAKEP